MYPLKKALVNKAGLLASALIALLVITSCSDSGTSTTGITPLSRDAAETGAINNAALKKEDNGEHSDTDPGHSHSPDQQHGEAGNVVTSTTVLALAAIPASSCGNLIQEAGEQCDAGLSGSATCTANCTLKEGRGGEIVAESFCGDGTKDAGEQCDDGNSNNADSCTQYCKLAVCGDGYTQSANGEQCDDKNKVDTDACSNKCQRQESTAAVTTTTVSTVDNTGGGTDIVLTNTVNDKTADVVTDSGDSGTITQRTTTTDDTNGTKSSDEGKGEGKGEEQPTVVAVAITTEPSKEQEAQTDGQMILPRDCEAEAVEIEEACIAEYDDKPRCTTYTVEEDWFKGEKAWGLTWCSLAVKAGANGSIFAGYSGVSACDVICKVDVSESDKLKIIQAMGAWNCPEYKAVVTAQDCSEDEHSRQCGKEAMAVEKECKANFEASMGM